jgi:hypothetical protein
MTILGKGKGKASERYWGGPAKRVRYGSYGDVGLLLERR